MADFLMNYWYLAAWEHEIGEKPVRRMLLGYPVALFRDSKGEIQAIIDRCSHRFAPLSEGIVKGDSVECPYHGLQFNGKGQCSLNPFTGKPHPQADIRSFPIVQDEEFVWIWPGDPELAEQTPIPKYKPRLIQTPQHYLTFMHEMQESNHLLGLDNLMDLTHAGYVHRPSFGQGTEEMTRLFNGARKKMYEEDGKVIMRLEYLDDKGEMMEGMWVETIWEPPGRIIISKGHSNEVPITIGALWENLHMHTPATKDLTHYFTAEPYTSENGRDLDHEARIDAFFSKKVFKSEDDYMMKFVWEDMKGEEDIFKLNPVLLETDAGAVRARRVYKRLLDAQNAALNANQAAE